MISDVGLRLSDFDLQHINVFANDILISTPLKRKSEVEHPKQRNPQRS
jgi:hypothetical protein